MIRHLSRLQHAPRRPHANAFTLPAAPVCSSGYRSFWGGSGADKDAPEAQTSPKNGGKKGGEIVPQVGDNAPRVNPLLTLPLVRRPVLPGFMSALTVTDEAIGNAIVRNVENGNNYVGIFLRKDHKTFNQSYSSTAEQADFAPPELITDISQLHSVGSFAQIQNVSRNEAGTQLLLQSHRRITLERVSSYGPPLIAEVAHWRRPTIDLEKPSIKAYSNEVVAAVRDLLKINPLAQQHMQQWVSRIELSDPFKLADFAAAMTTADSEDLQRILECADPEQRLSLALELLTKEKELAKLQRDISKQVEEKMSKQQREYFLREQLKSIKSELGLERDDKDELLSKYHDKVKQFKQRAVHEDILKVIEDELKKMSHLERNSPEFNVTRSYLDWLTSMPWGVATVDKLNVTDAQATLDRDHYGLEDIKKRILEFIAVGKLRGTVAGKIICFIGPPGVGKTSIAKSIASALNKQFYRFSVGGLTDIAEIKGHRRTYIGAMPGKPVQCLKTTECTNPLILIDEIDKLGRGHSGDPASALLELLDPNQNESFVDHYLDVKVDFSKVLFVCTANDESAIPGPLRDRMEIIRLAGYDIPEKVAIATRYLVPKALLETGLAACPNYSVNITPDALEALVKNYCRESGVRNLEKHIEQVARKIAFNAVGRQEIVSAEADNLKDLTGSVTVTAETLAEYVGKAKFTGDTIYDNKDAPLPPGVVMGLAWNPMGGSPVFIEAAAIKTAASEAGGGVNVITGQLGSVMKESVNIAYTFARQFIAQRQEDNAFFKCHQLHVHVPEGAVEKDGPSAGVAMATALISLATARPLRPRLAMTGELSLTGKVLPVGGIKEKTLAARRSGADTVVLPLQNKRDYDDLPAYVKDNMTVHFVSDYQQVYDVAFEKAVKREKI